MSELRVSDAKTVVKFGTDGWRGIYRPDDFTYENVRITRKAAAIANYVLEHEDAKAGVCIGWDTRFGSRSFAEVVAEVLVGAGIPVVIAKERDAYMPALSFESAAAEGCGWG